MSKQMTLSEMGRKGGRAGKGASQVRGGSEHYRTMAAARKPLGVYERKGDRGGWTVREGRGAWIVEGWSINDGSQSGWKYRVAYDARPDLRGLPLDKVINEHFTPVAKCILEHVRGHGHVKHPRNGVRVIRRGHIVGR